MIGDIIRLVKALPQAYTCYLKQMRDNLERDVLTAQLMGFGYKWDIANGPAFDIGTALRMAEQYHIEFHIGTCYSQCRAVLPREYWQLEMLPDVKSSEFGSFWENEPHDEIESIYAFGEDIRIALCKCLINAKMAGVL